MRHTLTALLVLVLVGCTGSSGQPQATPPELRVVSGPYQWSISTSPDPVSHTSPVLFKVRVSDPLYAYVTTIDYGDGSHMDVGGGGGVSCVAGTGGGETTAPQEPGGDPVTSSSDDSAPWTVTVNVNRPRLAYVFAAPCPSANGRSGTAALTFDVI